MSLAGLSKLLKASQRNIKETKEETVIRLLKGGFEEQHGMSFDEFVKIQNDLIKHKPEKLI